MKIKGEFILREMAGDTVLVPVGETALRFNGIVILRPVAATIWKGIEVGLEKDQILREILERFDVEADMAEKDMEAFLGQLQSNDFLEE